MNGTPWFPVGREVAQVMTPVPFTRDGAVDAR
jgi:hypothetical protein